MKTLIGFGQKEAYKRVEQLGDRLAEIKSLVVGSVSPDRGGYLR